MQGRGAPPREGAQGPHRSRPAHHRREATATNPVRARRGPDARFRNAKEPALWTARGTTCELEVDFPTPNPQVWGRRPAYWWMASASMSILTCLPTSTPPVSRAWFQVSPKASRSSSALGGEADAAAAPRVLGAALEGDLERHREGDAPHRELAVHRPAAVAGRRDLGGAVAQRRVVARRRRSPAERRCPSRVSSRVSIDATGISTSTKDSSGSSTMWMAPLTSAKRPFVLDTIRWRTLKPTWLWDASRA